MIPVKVKYNYAYRTVERTVYVPRNYSDPEIKEFAEKIFKQLDVPADKNKIEIISKN